MKQQTHIYTRSFILLCALLVASLYADEKDEVIERTFDVKAGGTLTIDSDIGAIEVESGRSERIMARVIRRAERKRDQEFLLEEFKIEFIHSGNDVTISGEFKDRRGKWDWDDWGRMDVRFVVEVPENYNVDLETSGGSISVGNLTGKVEANTSGGSLSFGKIKGPIYGRTSGGSITLESSVGKADIKTSGGSIRIGDVDGDVDAYTSGGSIKIEQARGDVVAHTSGGSISVDEVFGYIDASTSGGSVTATINKQPKSNCRLETSGGSVTVYLADNIAVDLDARSSWGRVDTDFEVTVQGKLDESSIRGKINGGGPELKLRTSAGKVRIKRI